MNPQANHGRQQQETEEDVESMFSRSFFGGFALARVDHGSFDLFIDGCKRQPGKLLAVRRFGHFKLTVTSTETSRLPQT